MFPDAFAQLGLAVVIVWTVRYGIGFAITTYYEWLALAHRKEAELNRVYPKSTLVPVDEPRFRREAR